MESGKEVSRDVGQGIVPSPGGHPASPAAMPVPPYSRPYEEDEIDLLDLFIVLVKRRRLVVGLPLLAALVTGVVLFLLPALGLISFQTYTLQAVMTSVQLPPALRDQVGLDLNGLAVSFGQEFHTVMDAVAKNNLGVDGEKTDPQDIRFRTYILKSFIGKAYKVTSGKEGVRFEVQVKDQEAGKRFLKDMIDRVDGNLRKRVAERSRIIHESIEPLYKEALPTSVLSDAVKQLITASYIYKDGTVPILVAVSEPETFLESQKRSVTFILAVVAAFFLAVFLAFILEYVENIKKDPERMGKLRAAWGKGP